MTDPQHTAPTTPSDPDTIATEYTVLHVMRTYGAHGGERQLAQYFSAQPDGNLREHFAFLYRDDACAALFKSKHARVLQHNLIPWSILPRQNPWHEVLFTVAFLPFVQLRLLFLLWRVEARICVVHGVQAAITAWLAGMMLRRVGFMYVHRTTKRTGHTKFLRFLYAPYRVIAGVSKSATDSLHGLAPAAEYIALENGVDVAAINRQSKMGDSPHQTERKTIIAVGRLLPSKRQDLLIDATAHLIGTDHDVELWIVGDGPERDALTARVDRLGISSHVRFWGHRSDIPQLLKAATIFVNASAWEGLSNAVLEAMAIGLPSVVVDAPGVTECHVQQQTGLVVDASAESIAEAVSLLLNDEPLAARLGAAARERVSRVYSVAANRQRFLDVYRRLAGVA